MERLQLVVEPREGVGSGASKKLRAEEKIPAVIYQRGEDNLNVVLVAKDFDKVLSVAGTSALVDLVMGDEKKTVLIKDVQMHPWKNQYLHVDFLGVRMDETVKVMVPIVLVGRDDIRLQPSVLTQNLDEIEVECLPANIPQTAEVEVEEMQYDEVKYVKDLDIFGKEGIEILAEQDDVICSLSEPREEEIPEDEEGEEVDAADVPVIGEDEKEAEDEE